MYPNYTKAFLNLEGVFIKSGSGRILSLYLHPVPTVEMVTCPQGGAKTKRFMITVYKKSRTFPLLGNK